MSPERSAPPATVSSVRSAPFSELDPRTAYLLWRLRSEVFVVEQDCPYLDLDGRDLEPQTVHLWVETAEDPGTPLGTLRILQEPEPGVVAHTSISKFLVNPTISGWIQFEARDTWPATTRVCTCIQELSSSNNRTRQKLADPTTIDCRRDPEMAKFSTTQPNRLGTRQQ